jgi:hypothetical protein
VHISANLTPTLVRSTSNDVEVDADDPMTHRAIVGQPKFVKVITDVCSHIDATVAAKEQFLFGVACKTGYHRADTCGRHIANVLNSIYTSKGDRCYNVQHFAMHKEYPMDAHHTVDVATNLIL